MTFWTTIYSYELTVSKPSDIKYDDLFELRLIIPVNIIAIWNSYADIGEANLLNIKKHLH